MRHWRVVSLMEIIILRKEADLGFAAEQELRTILRKDIETRKDINKFRGEAKISSDHA